jgi:hypothetical protein
MEMIDSSMEQSHFIKPELSAIWRNTHLIAAVSCALVSACHHSLRNPNNTHALEVACVVGRPVLSTEFQPSGGNDVQTLQSAVRCFINPLLDQNARRTCRWPSFDEVTNTVTYLDQKQRADAAKLEARRTVVIEEIDHTPDTDEKMRSLASELSALNMAAHILKLCAASTDDFECTAHYLARMHVSQDLYREYGGSVLIIAPANFCEGPLPEIIPLTAYSHFLLDAVKNGQVTFNAQALKEQVPLIFEKAYKNRALNQDEILRWLDADVQALSDLTPQ